MAWLLHRCALGRSFGDVRCGRLEEMAVIRADIQHMLAVSGVIFLLLIALGLVLA
jgi:hypothetical protein